MAFLMAMRRTAASPASSALFTRFLNGTVLKPSAAGVAPITTSSITSSIPIILGDEPRVTLNALGGSYPRSEQFPIERGGYSDEYINPFQTSGSRGAYEINHVDEGLYVRMEMPGIDKEDVKVWNEYGTVYVKGIGNNKQSRFEKLRRAYSATIEIPSDTFHAGKIEVDVKNGVLRMLIPNKESTNLGQV
ncbi:heat shock 22 kDa protein, mitochondrial [Coffea arabica]|uniref:Heat shock 22 kDa protein, mitochondrial n=1 Tax=Coffea arabica TaxID=13443 RepID=A0A6P6TQX5_COFAR|nr:heat shock 22 kDa protein, mitochondrial-like [Coffea arabica]